MYMPSDGRSSLEDLCSSQCLELEEDWNWATHLRAVKKDRSKECAYIHVGGQVELMYRRSSRSIVHLGLV